jgi:hypothetical protein
MASTYHEVAGQHVRRANDHAQPTILRLSHMTLTGWSARRS